MIWGKAGGRGEGRWKGLSQKCAPTSDNLHVHLGGHPIHQVQGDTCYREGGMLFRPQVAGIIFIFRWRNGTSSISDSQWLLTSFLSPFPPPPCLLQPFSPSLHPPSSLLPSFLPVFVNLAVIKWYLQVFVTIILSVVTEGEQFSSFVYNLYILLWIACLHNLPINLLGSFFSCNLWFISTTNIY